MKKKIITICIVLVFYIIFDFASNRYITGGELYKICTWLSYYIDNNKGMPHSEKELIDNGYIKKDKDTFLLLFNPNKNDEVISIKSFNDYTIGYGISTEQIEKKGNKLVDDTGKQVYLIKGKKQKYNLNELYEKYSMILYERLVAIQK